MKINIKPIRSFLFLLVAGLLAGGCIKDISNEIPEAKPKITLNGFFNPRFPVVVSISKSGSILDTLGANYLSEAKGMLYENDLVIDSLIYYPEFNLHVAAGLSVPQIGKNYRLEVSAPGLSPVQAGSVLPDSVPILSVETDTLFYAVSGENTYWLRIRFQDPAGMGNLYHLMVYRSRLRPNGNWEISPLCFESDDNSFEVISREFCSGGLFSDAGFNGQEKELLINTRRRINPTLSDSLKFIVELRHGSAPYYQYNKSLGIYKNNQGDIFAQPGPIIGNVSQGYGIFAGYAPSTDTIAY